MKEIIRIHIAKISYDIENVAKKELETYLKMLGVYSNDTDIIEDIEIRITEILAERDVKKDGVISIGDVKALKQQLGDPREFMSDEIVVNSEDDSTSGLSSRRLYRNTDSAVFGGVLSGIAAFFEVNPLWTRLLFIIIAFASLGMAILVYIVLWIAIPSATTATDKLQMAGRPVTAKSIRELSENEASKIPSESDFNRRRALTILAGIGCVFVALATALMLLVFSFKAAFHSQGVLTSGPGSGFFLAAFILWIVAGLLLVTLFILLAYISFTQKITRRIVITISTVVALGLISFVTAIGLLRYESFYYGNSTTAIYQTIDRPITTLPIGPDYIRK
jgi:phage shock protein PspC (stress-responsive transcriptional regulator)